jgi:hypothetical protein
LNTTTQKGLQRFQLPPFRAVIPNEQDYGQQQGKALYNVRSVKAQFV